MKVFNFVKSHKIVASALVLGVLYSGGVGAVYNESMSKPQIKKASVIESKPQATEEKVKVVESKTDPSPKTVEQPRQTVQTEPPVQPEPELPAERSIRQIADDAIFYRPEYKNKYVNCAEKYDSTKGFVTDTQDTREQKIRKFFRMYGVESPDGNFRIVNIDFDC